MSKLRTLGHLQDGLDKEFAWRVKEIADLKASVRTGASLAKATLIRAGVPLLYAHWEGFIKRASEIYLEFVEGQRLTYDELADCMVVFGARRHLHNLFLTRDPTAHGKAVDFFRRRLSDRAQFPGAGSVNTKANLSSEIFSEIAGSLGLSLSVYEAFYNLIDESLLNRRNKIAHGEYLDLSADDFRSLADEVLHLLRSYKTDLENISALEGYRSAKGSAPAGIPAV